uniref:Uncharacterized LOC103373116 n=1 Tax=Stegastes partitus TaxID=144197 RepID=A0A3B5A8Q2_9TELE
FAVISDSTSCLFRLLLLAELLIHSSCQSTLSCSMFGSMIHQVDKLLNSSKRLHNLTKEELVKFAAVEHRLSSLPHIQHTVGDFNSLKVNESLSQLYSHTLSFRVHVDWLKTAKENVSLPIQSAETTSTQLQQLFRLANTSLHQIREEVPQTTSPSLPEVSLAFDALKFSVEISDRLQAFCHWSKRALRRLQRQSRCPGR